MSLVIMLGVVWSNLFRQFIKDSSDTDRETREYQREQ
jgi:hypothetical protein